MLNLPSSQLETVRDKPLGHLIHHIWTIVMKNEAVIQWKYTFKVPPWDWLRGQSDFIYKGDRDVHEDWFRCLYSDGSDREKQVRCYLWKFESWLRLRWRNLDRRRWLFLVVVPWSWCQNMAKRFSRSLCEAHNEDLKEALSIVHLIVTEG